jgi:hypothetical protein
MDSKRVWFLLRDLFNNAPKSVLEDVIPTVFYWDHFYVEGKSALSFESDYLTDDIENWGNELKQGMKSANYKGGFFVLMLVKESPDVEYKFMMTLYDKANNIIESSTCDLNLVDVVYNEEVPFFLLYDYESDQCFEVGH